jgi:hypothetical protein
MPSIRPPARTSIAGSVPWKLELHYTRQVHCPVCGLRLPPNAARVAANLLVCMPCIATQPRAVTMALAICHSLTVPETWAMSHGIYAYISRLGIERSVIEHAKLISRWPPADQPANYAPYCDDWPRYLDAALQQ